MTKKEIILRMMQGNDSLKNLNQIEESINLLKAIAQKAGISEEQAAVAAGMVLDRIGNEELCTQDIISFISSDDKIDAKTAKNAAETMSTYFKIFIKDMTKAISTLLKLLSGKKLNLSEELSISFAKTTSKKRGRTEIHPPMKLNMISAMLKKTHVRAKTGRASIAKKMSTRGLISKGFKR